MAKAAFSIFFFARLLARDQEGPVTGHLNTGFLGFPLSPSISCCGFQHSKLLLHASYAALPD